jgi:thioredoxin 1
MQTISSEQFDLAVLGADKAVLVDFFANWCGPCHMMTPVLEQLSAARGDLEVVKVDIDAEPELASRYGVQSIPTMILFESGEERKRVIGAQPLQALARALELEVA